jgi:hypothetical protein
MRARGRWVRGVVLSAFLLGCATPSRRLTTRVVDDPMVLPRGLFGLTVHAAATKYSLRDDLFWTWPLRFRYGITDRLELSDLGLRYAFLDDAPAYADGAPDGRRHGPLSLSVRAGVDGIGFSSFQGFIVLPTLSVLARKHLGGRAYVWADVGADGAWTTEPGIFPRRYSASLWPTWPNSRVALSAGGIVQVVDRVALGVSGGVDQIHGCAVFDCAWAARGAWGSAGPIVRPWRWLNLSLYGELGGRERSAVEPDMIDPSAPIATLPPDHVWWWSLGATATFYW